MEKNKSENKSFVTCNGVKQLVFFLYAVVSVYVSLRVDIFNQKKVKWGLKTDEMYVIQIDKQPGKGLIKID